MNIDEAKRTTLKSSDTIHNTAIRTTIGAFSSSPVASTLWEANEMKLK